MPILKNERGVTTQETFEFVLEECCSCGIPFLIPGYHRKRLLNTQEYFYCPNGHPQHYTGKTEAQKLQEQLEIEKKRSQQDLEEMANRLLDAISEKTKLEKDLKRLKKGTCPCCNRSFQNLHNHMKNQHPDYTKA